MFKYEVWFEEWVHATDPWLAGFNDSRDEYPYTRDWVSRSYLPADVAVDFDRTAPILGPFGQYDRNVIRMVFARLIRPTTIIAMSIL